MAYRRTDDKHEMRNARTRRAHLRTMPGRDMPVPTAPRGALDKLVETL
ncbi:MAG: hypothetical protein U0230_08920 [Polyangiales bacterium]